MKVNAYLHFNGDCEAALKFYEKHLGEEIEMLSTFEGSPAAESAPADWGKKILHARMALGDTVLLASDAPPGHYAKPQGFSISLGMDTPEDAECVFQALCEAGAVSMPMQLTFFAKRFGMVTDQFDIPWMVICANPS
ncbi:MAG TPA: VOC family protein [Rhizomicrobium sp.]